MNNINRVKFAGRLLAREWRSGQLWLLVVALVIAITSHTTIGHFSDRISRAINHNVNNLISGDLIFESPKPIETEIEQWATSRNLEHANSTRFQSMASADNKFQLVRVNAVSDNYPLKGDIKVTDELYGANYGVQQAPKPGEAWLDASAALRLDLDIGDPLTIGNQTLIFSKVLVQTLDSGGGFYSAVPRIMIHEQDMYAAGVVGPNTPRVRYHKLFSGAEPDILSLRAQIEPTMTSSQELNDIYSEQPGVASSLDKAKEFTGLASLIALLLAAVAVASSGQHYIRRQFDHCALMRCMGASQTDILFIYLSQFVILALVAGIIGNVLGYTIQQGLFALTQQLLPQNIPSARWGVVISGMFLSLIVLLGFTLPAILQLKNVSPIKVLRKETMPLTLSARITYLATFIFIVILMWLYTQNLFLTLSIIAGAFFVFLVGLIIIFALFWLLEQIVPTIPPNLRSGIRNFLRRRRTTGAQTIALGLTIMALLVTYLLRTDLLETWSNTIREDASNHIMLNLQTADKDSYEQFLKDNNVRYEKIYPIVSGRLTRINNEPVHTQVSKEQQDHNSLRRELYLTWSDTILPDNVLLEGDWWSADSTEALASVESNIAADLGIQLGDELTMVTGAQQWQAKVHNIREVDWGNFKPNFYLIFNQKTLKDLPTTWINGFNLTPEQKPLLLEMIDRYPSISLLELDTLIEQAQKIIDQVSWVIHALLFFVLLAAVAVILAEIKSSMSERILEGAIVRTLGASSQQIRIAQWSEFAAIGIFAGLIGICGAEVINSLIYQKFDFEYQANWLAWPIVLLLSALIIGWMGVINSRSVVNHSPLHSIRNQ